MTYIRKPEWLRAKTPLTKEYGNVSKLMREMKLCTVCEEARCPNRSECWAERTASFLILGDTCTRSCKFCNVKKGTPSAGVDDLEPENLAQSVLQMGLKHVVITSVTRDDLKDGGAGQFVKSIEAIRKKSPETTIEVLTPDFMNQAGALEAVIKATPDVFNHNMETVPRLYKVVRSMGNYDYSLNVLKEVKAMSPSIFTKSGIMVGLGETEEEILQVMDDLRDVNVDFITIGQYLQPTAKHYSVSDYITPEKFEEYKKIAYDKGFLMVSSSPLTRSSHHAGEDFKRLVEKRENV